MLVKGGPGVFYILAPWYQQPPCDDNPGLDDQLIMVKMKNVCTMSAILSGVNVLSQHDIVNIEGLVQRLFYSRVSA